MSRLQSSVGSRPLLKTDEAAGNEMEDAPNHLRKPRPRKKNPIVFGLDSVNTLNVSGA